LSTKSLWRACAAAVLVAAPIMIIAQTCLSEARAQGGAQEPAEKTWHHGLSLFGEPKYSPGFAHFDYVNPNAPKGGVVRQIGLGTFDNFNPVTAGVKGNIAIGIGSLFSTLMAPALDEISTYYGLIAESVSYPDDFSSVTYRLRPTARWQDGVPVTPADVIFSLNTFKTNHPRYAAYYQHVTKVEQTGDRDVTFSFDSTGNRGRQRSISDQGVRAGPLDRL
jgi:microcin C transport system substrate-binding protein